MAPKAAVDIKHHLRTASLKQTGCTECALGLRSSPDETNGVCQPCGAGAQATDAGARYLRVVVFAACSGTTRC